MDEWAFVLIVALCIALVAYRIGETHWRKLSPRGLVGTGSALVLRTPQENIERYRDLLTTKLTEVELRYIDTEERFAIAILQFTSPIAP